MVAGWIVGGRLAGAQESSCRAATIVAGQVSILATDTVIYTPAAGKVLDRTKLTLQNFGIVTTNVIVYQAGLPIWRGTIAAGTSVSPLDGVNLNAGHTLSATSSGGNTYAALWGVLDTVGGCSTAVTFTTPVSVAVSNTVPVTFTASDPASNVRVTNAAVSDEFVLIATVLGLLSVGLVTGLKMWRAD